MAKQVGEFDAQDPLWRPIKGVPQACHVTEPIPKPTAPHCVMSGSVKLHEHLLDGPGNALALLLRSRMRTPAAAEAWQRHQSCVYLP